MLPVGFALLLLGSGSSAPPPLAVAAPRLQRGDELVYTGDIVEISERIENRFKKKHLLEVRVFVLEVGADSADCAVMTSVAPQDDAKIAEAVLVVSGSNGAKNRTPPTVHLQLVRVDSRGRVQSLESPGAPPLDLSKATGKPPPSLPLDDVPALELGFVIPLPLEGAKVGATWAIPDTARTPTVWTAAGDAIWNGGRAVELTAVQKSTGWDQPDTTPQGWHRAESILASPEEGYASTVKREIARRAGREVIGRVTVKYELQRTNRSVGKRYAELRNEIEQAAYFTAECGSCRTAADWQARSGKIARHLDDHPAGCSFRPALESLGCRCESAARGTAPAVVSTVAIRPSEPAPLRVGYPAPDFVVADVDRPTGRFRLSANKSKPTVAIFFKPGSATSREALTVAEALHRHFGERVSIVPLAIGEKAPAAAKQREELKLKVPVYDGLDMREAYGVTTFPKFFILESTGDLKWIFEAGIGPETGYLVKQQLEALVK